MPRMQFEYLARTDPELHDQLATVVRERGSGGGGGLLPVGLVAAEAQDGGVVNNMQAQSDYLRDMVVGSLLP